MSAPHAFTPGPWYVEDSNLPDPALIVQDEQGICLASVEHRPTYDEAADNANLIASAPILYAACESFLAWADEHEGILMLAPGYDTIHQQIEAAWEKARGDKS